MKKFILSMIATLVLAVSGLANAATPTQTVTFEEGQVIALRGVVDGASVAKLQQDLLSNPNKEVWLFIASPGGSVFAGMQLIDTIKSSPKRVKCVASIAASMAFAILQSCHERYVLDQSIIMQHVASFSTEGQEPNVVSFTKFLVRSLRKLEKREADRMGLSLSDFRKKVRDDWWMFGDEAVSNNAADAVIKVTCSEKLASKTVIDTVQTFFGPVDVTYSACPIIEAPLKVKFGNRLPMLDASKEAEGFMKKLQVRDLMQEWFRSHKNPLEVRD